MVVSTNDLPFPFVARKTVIARFDGGNITSDAGFVLLAKVDRKLGLCESLAGSVVDRRCQKRIVHSLAEMMRARIFAIAMGYEDANDFDTLADDPALRIACGRGLTKKERLASQPTLSRLENEVDSKDLLAMAMTLGEIVTRQLPKDTRRVILDVDATADPCYGQQELGLFNGHYQTDCYLPVYLHLTADDGVQRLAAAMLRPGSADAKVGLWPLLGRAIRLLTDRFPDVEIVLRADGAYGQAQVIAFCETNGLGFVLGLPANSRVQALAAPIESKALAAARESKDHEPYRGYASFKYQADSWENEQRVVERIEVKEGVLNARFVVTNLPELSAEALYQFYCGRGEQENRIKESKLDLASGRTSCHRFLANQFRLLLHTAAGVLFNAMQAALAGTHLANAQIGTIRLKLLKVGAQAKESVRAIWLRMSSTFTEQALWHTLSVRFGET